LTSVKGWPKSSLRLRMDFGAISYDHLEMGNIM
jgi:hypothetical protein